MFNNNNINNKYTYIGNKDEKSYRWATLTTFLLITLTLSVAFYGTMNGSRRVAIALATSSSSSSNLLHYTMTDNDNNAKGGDDDDDGNHDHHYQPDYYSDSDSDSDYYSDYYSDSDSDTKTKNPIMVGDNFAGIGDACGWQGNWFTIRFVACGSNLSCISRGICAANAKEGELCGDAAGGVDCLGSDHKCYENRCILCQSLFHHHLC